MTGSFKITQMSVKRLTEKFYLYLLTSIPLVSLLVFFHPDIITDWNGGNKLDSIPWQPYPSTGIKYMFDSKLVTVWSAPNYCYRAGNVASILCFTSTTEKQAKLFDAVPDDKRVIPPVHTTPYFLWKSCTVTTKCKLCIFLDGVFILPLRMNGYVVRGSPGEANEDCLIKILLVGWAAS